MPAQGRLDRVCPGVVSCGNGLRILYVCPNRKSAKSRRDVLSRYASWSSAVSPTECLLIERECERLVTTYCHYVDHGQARRIADLFTSDGVWTAPGVVTMTGTEELQKGLGEREARTDRRSRHVCNNLLLDVLDEDTAEGVVYLVLYRHDGGDDEKPAPVESPLMIGEYRDRFARTSEGWRFSRREVAVSFVRER